ncbi:vanZ like family protein [Hydrogenophaga sp. RAC07]|uniref:VanZ family protein n=1 Tax=Hydrogenophaga sp. RAC07 TaxID=1842537 RepID=UPI00083D113D|nr:VanZ family protein [Hydrogenophaga sp. RAC07]AOF88157.1 vanZ like family protein [Hydrogenophaga sp. RAC07]
MRPSGLHLIRTAFWCSATVLAIASLVPVDLLPQQAATIWDKGQHTFGFGWLALVGLLAYSHRPSTMIIALLAYGGVIELLQAATGWRYGEWLDFLADGVGVLIGAALWLLVRRLATPQT